MAQAAKGNTCIPNNHHHTDKASDKHGQPNRYTQKYQEQQYWKRGDAKG
jgi:hypothetical protein